MLLRRLFRFLTHTGFRCVVFDDRAEFSSQTLFPAAEKTITGDFEHIFHYLEIRECDYVCIMTRGHQSDYVVQRQILTRNACYVGVIGSRKKLASIKEKLMADGIPRDKIDSCHSPIGLEIYAETPAEIAISVAGELISIRAAGKEDAGNGKKSFLTGDSGEGKTTLLFHCLKSFGLLQADSIPSG